MRTALITGVTGQDGTYLAELLAGKGYRVVGMARDASPGMKPGVESLHADVELAALDARPSRDR